MHQLLIQWMVHLLYFPVTKILMYLRFLNYAVDEWSKGGTSKDAIVEDYGNIEEWDVSQIKDFNYLFGQTTLFDFDLSKWTICTSESIKKYSFIASN